MQWWADVCFSHSDYRNFGSIRNEAKNSILENKKQHVLKINSVHSLLWGEETNHMTDDVQDPFPECCTHDRSIWPTISKNTDLKFRCVQWNSFSQKNLHQTSSAFYQARKALFISETENSIVQKAIEDWILWHNSSGTNFVIALKSLI